MASASTGLVKGPWRRVLAPSVVARCLTVSMGAMLWLIALVIGGTSVSERPSSYVFAAAMVGALQLGCGLLMRASRWQGASVNRVGDLRLSSVYGVTDVPRTAVRRITVNPHTGSLFVWLDESVLWLEVGSRLGIGAPRRKTLARAVAVLGEAVGSASGFAADVALSEPRVRSLEFSFRGFGQVVSSPLVWVPMVVGQVLLASALL